LYLSAQQPAERNRLTAALRLIWVIPRRSLLYFVYIAAFFVAIVGWFRRAVHRRAARVR